MRRILIVDSDTDIRTLIAKYVRLEGYEATETGDGETAVSLCRHNTYDLIIMEPDLPGIDGFSVLQTLRICSQIPVLLLSSRCTEEDRIHGLELGADDYMAKPFSPQELMLRISAILRRGPSTEQLTPYTIQNSGINIDVTARRVTVDEVPVTLTPKEFDLLTLLTSHPNVAFSRKQLLDIIWGGELPQDTRTLDTHIKQIRRAIQPYSDRVVTLRGVGYRFE